MSGYNNLYRKFNYSDLITPCLNCSYSFHYVTSVLHITKFSLYLPDIPPATILIYKLL